MDSAVDGKSPEKRLKAAALAWACTLTRPTGFQILDPPVDDGWSLYYLCDLVTFTRCNADVLSSFLRM